MWMVAENRVWVFGAEEPQIAPETIVEAEADTIAGVEIESGLEGKPESGSDNCVKQAQHFLFKEWKPIGRPFGCHLEIH